MNHIIFILLILLSGLSAQGQNLLKFDSLGNKIAEGDTINGTMTFWYPDGQTKVTGFMKNSTPDRTWNYFSVSGKLILTEIYRNGTKYINKRITYFKNDSIQEIQTLRTEGELHNRSVKVYRDGIMFYPNGQLSLDAHFLNGKDTGSRYWNKKGKEITREEWMKIND